MEEFYRKAEYNLEKIELKSDKSGLWMLTKQLKKRSY
jgi:hypothetical protein